MKQDEWRLRLEKLERGRLDLRAPEGDEMIRYARDAAHVSHQMFEALIDCVMTLRRRCEALKLLCEAEQRRQGTRGRIATPVTRSLVRNDETGSAVQGGGLRSGRPTEGPESAGGGTSRTPSPTAGPESAGGGGMRACLPTAGPESAGGGGMRACLPTTVPGPAEGRRRLQIRWKDGSITEILADGYSIEAIGDSDYIVPYRLERIDEEPVAMLDEWESICWV